MSNVSMRDIMRGVEAASQPKPHKIANSTVEYWRPTGERVVRLHSTDILTFVGKGFSLNAPFVYALIEVRTGGWETTATIARLNTFLSPGFTLHAVRKVIYIGPTNPRWHEWQMDAQPILGGGIDIVGGKLPPHDHYLRTVARKSAVRRFCDHCESIGWRQEWHGSILLTPSWVESELHNKGRRWQAPYDDSFVGAILKEAALPTTKLVAHRLGSDRSRPALRKAARTYLLNLLGETSP